MGKKCKLVALMVVICMVTTLLPIVPVEEYEASEKVGSELLELLGITYEDLIARNFDDSTDTYTCIIWVEDIEIEDAIQAGIETAELTLSNNEGDDEALINYTTYEYNNLSCADIEVEEQTSAEYVQAYIEGEREAATELYMEKNNNFVVENFMARDLSVLYVSKYSPCVIAELTMGKIAELVEQDDVKYIEYLDELQFEDMSLSTSISDSEIEECMAVVKADVASNVYNVTGAGIKIGQIETACPNESTVVKNPNSNGNMINGVSQIHPNNVYKIMKMTAPGATFYATGMYATNYTAANSPDEMFEKIEWLLSQGVNIINMSIGYWSEIHVNKYSARTRWIDHIACNHNVHFVVASGNEMTREEEVDRGVSEPGLAYNVITVGNTYRTSPYNIYPSSSYNHDGLNSTTYKPDVVAPGTYTGGAGTSFSAPLVTGIIALLCEKFPSLKTEPHAVKAILAATCTGTAHRYETTDANFEIYGAGIVDAYSAIYEMVYDENMWVTGTLQMPGTTQNYTISVTPSDSYVRVALAYENKIMYSGSNHSSSNVPDAAIGTLFIEIFAPNGNLVASVYQSGLERQANLKVVEFTPNGVYGNYTVKITLSNIASNMNTIEFAVARR